MKQNALIAGLLAAVLVLSLALVFALRPRSVTFDPADASTLPQIVLRDDVTVFINSMHEANSILFVLGGQPLQPSRSEHAFLVCNLTIKNTGSQPVEISPYFFRMYSSETMFYMGKPADLSGAYGTEQTTFTITLPPNEALTGNMAFDVPAGTKPIKIGMDSGQRTVN